MNYLEQIAAEWLEFQGYFVRRNVLVGKREAGGYECELDVVGLNPETLHVIHVEASMDANSWLYREAKYLKKFDAGRRHIPGLFPGFTLTGQIEQIALMGYASKASRSELGGGKLMLVGELIAEILEAIKARRIASNAIPEDKPIMRTLQFVCENRRAVVEALTTT